MCIHTLFAVITCSLLPSFFFMLSVAFSLLYPGNLNVLAFIGGVFFIIISLGIFVTVVCFNGKRRNQCNSVGSANKKRGKWKWIESIIRLTLFFPPSFHPFCNVTTTSNLPLKKNTELKYWYVFVCPLWLVTLFPIILAIVIQIYRSKWKRAWIYNR